MPHLSNVFLIRFVFIILPPFEHRKKKGSIFNGNKLNDHNVLL